MNELAEILSLVDGELKEKITKLCANYEREIRSLERQFQALRKNTIENEWVNKRDISKAARDVYASVRRSDECHLFYNAAAKKLRALTSPVRIAKEASYSVLIGVYSEGFNRKELIEDICEVVNVKSE